MDYRANLRTWTTALRETRRKQARGWLGVVEDGQVVANCCLGVGAEVAGCGVKIKESGGRYDKFAEYDETARIAPKKLLEFLGVPVHFAGVTPDWGDLEDPNSRRYGLNSAGGTYISAVWMNDEMTMTFSQIADVFDYFGVAGVDYNDERAA